MRPHRAHLVRVLALDPQGGRIAPGTGRLDLVDVDHRRALVAALLDTCGKAEAQMTVKALLVETA